MYVCVCNAVRERDVQSAIAGGCRNLRDLRTQLGVAAECGRCAVCAHSLLRKTAHSVTAHQTRQAAPQSSAACAA